MNDSGLSSNTPKAFAPSDWWVRLYEGEHEGATVTQSNDDAAPSSSFESSSSSTSSVLSRPANRRSYSATVFRTDDDSNNSRNNNDGENDDGNVEEDGVASSSGGEWMIVTGGFTDEDWTSFPVWACDLTHSRSGVEEMTMHEKEEDSNNGGGGGHVDDVASGAISSNNSRPPWSDLTGLGIGAASSSSSGSSSSSSGSSSSGATWEEIVSLERGEWPRGRVGHLTSVRGGCLYVFGGLTYAERSFRAEEDDYDYTRDEIRFPEKGDGSGGTSDDPPRGKAVVWKACGLEDLLHGKKRSDASSDDSDTNAEDKTGDGDGDGKRTGPPGALLQCERIRPRVVLDAPLSPQVEADINDAEHQNGSGF